MAVTMAQTLARVRRRANDGVSLRWSNQDIREAIEEALMTAWPGFFEYVEDSTSFAGVNALDADTQEIAVPTAFLPSGDRGPGRITRIEARMTDGTLTDPIYHKWFTLKRNIKYIDPLTAPSPKIRFLQTYAAACEVRLFGIRPLAIQNYAFTAANTGDLFTGPSSGLVSNGSTVVLSSTEATFPTGITGETTYFVVNATGATFQLATTKGGAAVPVTADGEGTFTITSSAIMTNEVPGFSEWLVEKTLSILFATRQRASGYDHQAATQRRVMAEQMAAQHMADYKMTPPAITIWGM